MSYSPTIGRWMERDPIGYDDGMNPYQIERSNPTNFVDPSGLLTVHIWRPQPGTMGHASLTLEDGTHISWWPNNPNADKNTDAPANPNQRYDGPGNSDVNLEGRNPDVNIKLNKLDEKAIKEWWEKYKSDPKHTWNRKDNCSRIALSALEAGGLPDTDIEASTVYFTTPGDVENTAERAAEHEKNPPGILYKTWRVFWQIIVNG